MWVARDKNGNLRWFETKPSRDWGEYEDYVKNELTVWKDGIIQNNEHILPSDLFPDLKWEDEPLEVNLVAVPPQNINLDYEVAKALYSELPDKDSLTGISLKNRIDSYEKS